MVVKGTVEVDTGGAAQGLKDLQEDIPVALNRIAYHICLEVKNEITLRTLRGLIYKSRGIFNDLRLYMLSRPIEESDGTVVYGLPDGDTFPSGYNGTIQKMAEIGLFFEKGGTVTPKSSGVKFLRIPLKPALTDGGYDREMGVKLRDEKESSGYYPFRTAEGKLFLGKVGEFSGRGKNKVPKAYYALVKSATIMGRPWFSFAVANVKRRISGIVPEQFRQYIRSSEVQ